MEPKNWFITYSNADKSTECKHDWFNTDMWLSGFANGIQHCDKKYVCLKCGATAIESN